MQVSQFVDQSKCLQFAVIDNSKYKYSLELDLPPLVSAVCGCGFAASVCWFPRPSLPPQDPHGPSDLWRGSTSFVLWLLSMPQICWNVHSPVDEEQSIERLSFISFGEKVMNCLSTTEWKTFSMCIHTCIPS